MTCFLAQLRTSGPADWSDRPVAIIGGGPSLKGFDLQRLADRYRVLVVNAQIMDLPWAHAGFSLDRRAMRVWWPRLTEASMPLYFAIPDVRLVNFTAPPSPNMTFIRRVGGMWFNANPHCISCGGTSGYGALQLAFKKGAGAITLFGFDYGAPAAGEQHVNENHYRQFRPQQDAMWRQFARAFDHAAPLLRRAGVRVLNASPGSSITAFPKADPESALHDPCLRRL